MDKPSSIMILGTEWKIEYRKGKEDAGLKNRSGYCDATIRTLVIRKFHEVPKSYECADLREYERLCLRHEIIHAFLYESGLEASSCAINHWAANEEMVDWIAYQAPKIFAAYTTLGLM